MVARPARADSAARGSGAGIDDATALAGAPRASAEGTEPFAEAASGGADALGAGDIRRWLDSDAVIVANPDTCCPGTRHTQDLPVLGGRLTVPTGLLALASGRGLETRAMAVPEQWMAWSSPHHANA
ncbi:hypothetical protein [Streptomyces cyaneofuscatus]|uniref:hypothetical protein n=1 Tax=Streptomyces cyaneofuscatus TaxID=66883 RepID=UPI003426A1BD